MTSPENPLPPASSIGSRLLFGALGLIALGVATIITLGAALAGVIAIVITGAVLARKERRLTRRGAWFAGVIGTMAVLVVLIGAAMLFTSSATPPTSAAERAEARAKARESVPDWLRAMNPNAQQQTAVADSMADRLLNNKPVMIWAGMMGAVLMSTLIGVIAGSFAWGGFMLLYRAATGDWLAGSTAVSTLPATVVQG
jgi:hypothetical protein